MADIFDFYVYDDRSIQFALAEPIMLEDKDVTQFRFRIPKSLNGFDMSGWEWWFIFVNPKGTKYTTLLELSDDEDEPDEYSVATYTVGYGFSGIVGTVRFSIEALNVSGEEIVNEWHTKTYATAVIDTLQGLRVVIPEPEGQSSTGITEEVKQALLQIARKVAYIDEHGQTYYDALYNALYAITAVTVSPRSISLSAIGQTSQLTAQTTPAGGTITWNTSNASVATVSANGLVTATGFGSATITATSGGKSGTCSVLVAEATLEDISAVYTPSGTVYESDSLDSLKSGLAVTAHWSNGTTSEVGSEDYTLSGTLTMGTSTVTVSYSGMLTTFDVTVVGLTGITATYTQSGTVYDTASLDDLKSDLVVTANYSDGTSDTVTDYTLSGTLAEGTSTVTVSYAGKTTSFNVTVTGIEWYEAQISDATGWSYPSYNGTQYAGANGLNTTEPNIKFVSAMNGTRPVLWNNMPTTAERIKYTEGALVAAFDNKGTSSANSALRSISFSDSAIAMLRSLKISYAPNFTGLDADLSDASNLTSVTMQNNTSMAALPILPPSVTTMSFSGNTALVDLSDWETPSSVTNMRTAFQKCSSLVKAPIINAPNCTSFNIAFSGCNAVKEITIEDIDTNLLYGGSNVALLVTSGGLARTAYFMIKCAPNNTAFPVIREQLASSNRTYEEMTYSMTGRTANTVNRICMYGDSLTKYNGDTGTYGTMPAQLLGMMADNVVVQNFGYAGQTASSYKSYFDKRADLQADVSVVWFGTNNIGMTGADIASQIQTNIIDELASDKYIVIGLLQGNYTPDRNTAMASAFGNHYLDIHAYTLANWETITGLTPTSDDITAVTNGNIPPSLLQSDSVHLNAYSGLVVATAIKEKLLTLGYIDNTWLA